MIKIGSYVVFGRDDYYHDEVYQIDDIIGEEVLINKCFKYGRLVHMNLKYRGNINQFYEVLGFNENGPHTHRYYSVVIPKMKKRVVRD